MKKNSHNELFEAALYNFHNGNFSEAILLLRKILKIKPNDFDALHVMGVIYGIENEHREANYYFKKAIKLNPDNSFVNFNYAKSLSEMGLDLEAIKYHQNAVNFSNNHPEAWLNYGLSLFRLKRYTEALHIYDQAIKLKSDYAEAWNNKGITLNDLSRFDEALIHYDQAIKLKSDYAEAWNNKGLTLNDLSRFDEAMIHFDQAIKLKSDYAEAWNNKGISLNGLSHFDDALIHFDQAIKLKPNDAEAWNNKGIALNNLRRFDEAMIHYDQAIKLKPDYADAWNNKGINLNNLRRFDESLIHFDQAIKIKPDYAEAWSNKGLTLNDLRRFDEALIHFDQAIKIKPDYAEAWNNKGLTLNDLSRFSESLIHYDQAIKLKPNYAEALSNKGVTLSNMRLFDEALDYHDQALKLNSKLHIAKFNKALINLALKNFDAGWSGYESRINIKNNFNDKFASETSNIPFWDGEKLCNHLLVYSEQGVGDEIFFIRMLNLINFKIRKITVVTDQRLVEIFSRSFPSIKFLKKDDGINQHLYESKILLGSLPNILLRSFTKSLPVSESYLLDNPDLTSKIKKLIHSESLTCGIAWQSSNEKLGKQKSISLVELKDILQIPGCEFVNLQYGDVANDISRTEALTGKRILTLNEINNFSDIDGVLSIIKACDVIVTTSNVTAHLAGAIGKRTFLLLPYSSGRFWYWHDEKVSHWYPSIHQFFQNSNFSWIGAIEQITQEIKDEIVRKN